jgi:hypothetical protein
MDYSQIDKAPEEKARGITISTAVSHEIALRPFRAHDSTSSTRRRADTMPTSTVPDTLIVSNPITDVQNRAETRHQGDYLARLLRHYADVVEHDYRCRSA